MHQPSHFWSPISNKQPPQTRRYSMKSQALNSDSHLNQQMATANSSNATSEKQKTISNHYQPLHQLAKTMESQYLKIEIDLEDLVDSYFSRSEMAAAEQLVQLSDHSDYDDTATSTDFFCNRRIGKEKAAGDEDERSEISSNYSAVRMKIEEIFGRFGEDDDHCEEREDNRRPGKRLKKYASLSEIYKMSTPLKTGYLSQVPLKGSMFKKVRYS